MEVKLNINNDAEIRKHVKDLIAGQVKSVVREEIRDILREVLSMKIKDTDIPSIDYLVQQEINKMIKNELEARFYDTTSFIKTEARKLVNEYIKEAFKKGDIIS